MKRKENDLNQTPMIMEPMLIFQGVGLVSSSICFRAAQGNLVNLEECNAEAANGIQSLGLGGWESRKLMEIIW